MDTTKNLKVIITASAGQAKAELASLGAATTSVSANLKAFGSSLSTAGAGLTAGLTVPIVAVGVASAKMAVDFQQQMTYVRTQAGDTQDSIADLSKQVLDLAKSSQFGPDELAKGLYHLASLGMRGADAMTALNTAQQMAAVGGADLESTTSALGAALVTGIQGTKDLSEAAGTLNGIIGQGNMRMGDLVGALGSGILPVAKNAGLTLRDVGAALATLTDNGMGADESATRLRMTFALMEAPSRKANDQLAAIGMTSTQLAMDMRTKGLIPALADLKQHLLDTYGTTDLGKTKMATALTEIFGGGRSSAAAQTLIEQLDRMQTKFDEIGKTSGSFASDVAAQQQTASAKIKTAWAGIQADAIQLGSQSLPVLASAFSSLTDTIDKVVKKYEKLSPSAKTAVDDTVLLLAVSGPLMLGLSKLIKTVGAIGDAFLYLATPIAKALGAIILFSAKALAVYVPMIAKMVYQATLVGAEWIAQATRATVAWLIQLPKLLAEMSITAVKSTIYAADTGLAWVINAIRVSFVWVTQELPKLAVAFAQIALQASINAVKTSAAWVASAVKTSFAWVTTELPKIVMGFVTTSAAATAHAAITTAEWVGSSVKSATAWVVIQLPRIIASFAVMSASAIANAAVTTAAWVGSAITSTQSFVALRALVATPLVMPALVIAAALASIYEVYNAVKSINDAWDQVNRNADRAKKNNDSQIRNLQAQAAEARSRGDTHQVSVLAAQIRALGTYAGGTNYASGGLSLVGENGPELVNLPRGSQVFTAQKTQQMVNNTRTVSIGTIVLASGDAVKEMFKQIDRDNLLLSKGLSPARAMS